MAKVTVIMPAFNAARFIGEAIESVLAQSLQDWELIVVNDGSTDETPSIVRRCADPRVVLVDQENLGEAAARNAGLDRAQGEFIGFLDADDVFLPNALVDQVSFLDTHPELDVCVSDGYFCDASGKPGLRLSDVRPSVSSGNILEPLVLNPAVVSAISCTLTRRMSIERRNLRFDRQLVIGPDYDFWIALARDALFGYLDKCTFLYRVHDSNVTVRTGRRRRQADLLYGRLKVMQSAWFGDMAASTRYRFFYALLVETLAGEPETQLSILASCQFLALSPQHRAALLRHIAAGHLRDRSYWEYSVQWLQESVQLDPTDAKARVLLGTTRLGSAPTRAVLTLWQSVHGFRQHLVSMRRRQPRSVPASLGPRGD